MSNFYKDTMSGSLPIVEDHYGKDNNDQADGGSASRSSKITDISSSNNYKPLSPTTKTKIRSKFYEVETPATSTKSSSRPRLQDQDRNMSIVHHLLSTKEMEYCDFLNLNIAIGTYNVNGQYPTEKLTPWLSPDHYKTAPDIYAVGFQELDLSQQAFLFDTTQREHDWADRVKACLHPSVKYAELRRVRLVGMFLLVYVRKELLQHVDGRSVDAVSIGTGLLNRMGNKGGVAIRFKLYDTTICFVNTHLAAGNDELQRRNQDYREISKIRFFQYAPANFDQTPIGIFDHDMVFWLGDLNYRLQHSDPMHSVDIMDVKKACDSGVFDFLIPYDQLGQMQIQNLAFQDFKEGPLSFLPTYKYDPGTDIWDSSEKCRVPAWCDRILWAGERIKDPIVYTSVPQLKISDHKPVIGLFPVLAKRIDQKRYARFYEIALREADRLENEWLPTVSIDKTEFPFNDVKYLEPQVQTLTVKNTGQVPVQISFKNTRPNEETFCKRWLLVTPPNHTIKVGDEAVLDFQMLIDKEAAWDLNAGREKLEDILVLHSEKGKDYFLTITGTYVPSCFGQSLDALVGLTHPIRGVPVEQLIDLGPDINNSSFPPTVKLPVPKELWRLVDHIIKHGLDEPDLFGQAGSHGEFIAIREALDTGHPNQIPGSIYSVVEALLRFLDSLAEPVIPMRHTDRCLRELNDWYGCKQAIAELTPECHKTVFNYLIRFLKKVLDHSAQNGTNANALAMIFTPMLFRLDDSKPPTSNATNNASLGTTPLAVRAKYQHKLQAAVAFVMQFLTHDYDG